MYSHLSGSRNLWREEPSGELPESLSKYPHWDKIYQTQEQETRWCGSIKTFLDYSLQTSEEPELLAIKGMDREDKVKKNIGEINLPSPSKLQFSNLKYTLSKKERRNNPKSIRDFFFNILDTH